MLSNTVYAPPQTGLTNFLINDLIPAALEDKFIPVYIDFSDTSVPVTVAFLIGLERAVLGSPVSNYSFNVFKSLFVSKDGSACKKNDYLVESVVIDLKLLEEKNCDYIELIDQYIKKISNFRKILFIVDHVENLSIEEKNKDFLNYYKFLLENKRSMVKAIYATSDMEKWSVVFKNPQSPLNSEGAFVHKLPMLARVFVREVLYRIGSPAYLEEAIRCFDILGCRPGIFISIVGSWKGNSFSTLSEHVYAEMKHIESNLGKKENLISEKL